MKFDSSKMRLVIIATLAVACSVAGASAPGNGSLAAYISESWQAHPDVKSAQAVINEEARRTQMSAAWTNPSVSFGLMNAPQSFDLHSEPMTAWQFGIMQEIPVPGKLHASSQAGELRTQAAVASLEEAKYRLASAVSSAYYDLAAAAAVKTLLASGQELAAQARDAATARVSAGLGSQADILKSQAEVERWHVELINKQADVDRKRAALAYAIGRADASTIADPELPDSLPPRINLNAALSEDSMNATPELKRLRLQSDASGADVTRAKLDYWPNPTLGIMYGLREYLRTTSTSEMTGITTTTRLPQDPMISIELSAPVPLFYGRNQRARIEELSAVRGESEAHTAQARLA